VVVEKSVLLVPQVLHGGGDQREVLEEFDRDILVDRIAIGEQQRHLEHVEAELRHPGGAVRLFKDFAGEHHRAVKRADIVKS
jgi:hypothetical protein